ncbi:MAG: DNA polymerase III subunit delta [Sphingomonas sp. 28-62-20]|uniref:DNA polymerase III subunit delta n=1 Tax=Sphingomonas sp. 28-62-20 TaxID=1970433 RepID=UPI000BDCF0D3|nr:MAG: DNA polymerase III subunit delta [Sphingomonas sp. 28-62-20]
MKANVNQLRTAIDSGSSGVRLYLLHGPDESGAREWAARLARTMGPDAERVDLDGAALKADPGRLVTEAASLSLFGGARHIRVTGAGEESLEAVELLIAAERAGNPVAMIAPGIKGTGKLVKYAIATPSILSLQCYPLTGADSTQLATMIAAEHGLRATPTAAARLVAATNGDRAVLTREVEKLALFLDAAPDRPGPLDDAAIDAIGADLADAEMASAIQAAIDGDAALLGNELTRLSEAGVSPIPLLRGLVRRLMALAEMSGEVAAGAPITTVVDRHNVFFREKTGTARALRHWTPRRLNAAIDHLRRAERAIMASATAGQVLADAAFVAVARAVQRR